jgi:FAD/FMN-containing dehydrogenase
MTFERNFHELEYFVAFDAARRAIAAMRELMLDRLPASIFPMEVRTIARDSAHLSHSYQQDSVSISISGVPGTDYWGYLQEVDRLLGDYGARVHWGKLHFLSREQLVSRYPMAERFIEIRRQLDPTGVFLNGHLRPLFE